MVDPGMILSGLGLGLKALTLARGVLGDREVAAALYANGR